MQLARILEDQYEGIFADAPIESELELHALPVFEDEIPYCSRTEDSSDGTAGDEGLDSTMQVLSGRGSDLDLLWCVQLRQEMELVSLGYLFGPFVAGGSMHLVIGDNYR